MLTQNLHDSLRTVEDFVFDDALIGDNRILRPLCSASGIHDDGTLGGLIALGRRQLDDLILSRPEVIRGNGSICTSGQERRNDHISLAVYHIALTIKDVLSSKHLELRTGQNTVAASAGYRSRIAVVLIHIALVQLQFDHDRLIGDSKFCGFVAVYRGVQQDFLKDITSGAVSLLNDVFALAQRLGHGDAILIRHDGSGKAGAILVIVIHIEHNASDGITVAPVCFGQTDPALGRLIFHSDLICAEVFLVDHHFGGKALVNKVFRNLGFLDFVQAIGQQRRYRYTLCVRSDDCDHLAIAITVVGRQTGNPRDGELGTCQGFAGQFIQLADAQNTLNGLIGYAEISGFIRFHHRSQFHQIGDIAGGFVNLLYKVLALAECRGSCDAVFIRYHAGCKAGTKLVVVVDVELNTGNGVTVQTVGLRQPDPALGGFVLYNHFIGFQVVIRNGDVHRKTVVHKVFRDNGFFNLVDAIGQQRGFSNTVFASGNHSYHFAIAYPVAGRQTRNAGDGELRSSQRIAGELILLDDPNLALNGLIGRFQLGCFVRRNHRFQLYQLSNIAFGIGMFLDGVLALGQRRRNRHAVGIGGHAACKLSAASEVDVEPYTFDGMTIQSIRLGQLDPALGRLVLYADLVGLKIVLGDGHLRGETGIHEVFGSLGFFDPIDAVGQQWRLGNAVLVSGDHSHHFAIACAVVGRQTRNAGNGELCASQRIACELVLLDDPNLALNGLIGRIQNGCFVRGNNRFQLHQLSDIAFGVNMFLDGVLSLGQCRRNRHAVGIGGHAACKLSAASEVDVEPYTFDGMTIQSIRLGQLDPALGRLVLYADLVGLQVILVDANLRGETGVHKVFGSLGFLNLVDAIGQQRRLGNTVLAGDDHSHHFAIACAVVGRQTGNLCDGELRTSQHIASQLILLDNPDLTLNGLVLSGQVRCLFGTDFCLQFHQFSNITFGVGMFLNGVLALAQRRRNGHTFIVGGHAARKTGTICMEDIELHTGDRLIIQTVGLHDLDKARHGFVLHIKGIGLAVFVALHNCGIAAVEIAVRRSGFLDLVLAPLEPAGFSHTIGVGGDGDDFAHTCAIVRCRSRQSGDGEGCTSKRGTSHLIGFPNLDLGGGLVVLEGDARSLTVGDGHVLHIDAAERIPLRSGALTNGIGAGSDVGEGYNAVCTGGLGLDDGAAAHQIKDGTSQDGTGGCVLLGHADGTVRNLKRHRYGLQRIRQTFDGDQQLLNGFLGDADEETSFFFRRRHGFRLEAEGRGRGSNGDRIAAIEVIIRTILAVGMTGDGAVALADADQIGISRQLDSTDSPAIDRRHALVGNRDLAGHGTTGNAVGCQPAGVLQIHRRCIAAGSVEVLHLPVITDILRAFQLLDHLTDGELTSHTAPGTVIRVGTIQFHEGNRMTQHPADSVHGGILVHDAGIAGGVHVGRQINHRVGTSGLVAATGHPLPRTGEQVFKAVNYISLQEMRGGVDLAVSSHGSNLQILAIPAGTAMQTGLTGIEIAQACTDVTKAEAIHRRSGAKTEGHRTGGEGKSIVGDVKVLGVGVFSFFCQHIQGVEVRPLQGAVRMVIAVHERDAIPPAVKGILFHGFHLNSSVVHEEANRQIALVILGCGIIHGQEGPCIRTDQHEVAFLGNPDFINRLLFVLSHFFGRIRKQFAIFGEQDFTFGIYDNLTGKLLILYGKGIFLREFITGFPRQLLNGVFDRCFDHRIFLGGLFHRNILNGRHNLNRLFILDGIFHGCREDSRFHAIQQDQSEGGGLVQDCQIIIRQNAFGQIGGIHIGQLTGISHELHFQHVHGIQLDESSHQECAAGSDAAHILLKVRIGICTHRIIGHHIGIAGNLKHPLDRMLILGDFFRFGGDFILEVEFFFLRHIVGRLVFYDDFILDRGNLVGVFLRELLLIGQFFLLAIVGRQIFGGFLYRIIGRHKLVHHIRRKLGIIKHRDFTLCGNLFFRRLLFFRNRHFFHHFFRGGGVFLRLLQFRGRGDLFCEDCHGHPRQNKNHRKDKSKHPGQDRRVSHENLLVFYL